MMRGTAKVFLAACVLGALCLLAGCFLLLNEEPVARFLADPVRGGAPLSVRFDATSSYDPDGEIRAYRWSFGDGTFGAGSVVQHVYAAAGTYTARLTVEDARQASATAQLDIAVTAGTKYAIVIGIAAYPPPTPTLDYTDDDAIALQARLTSLPGWNADNILILTNFQATTVAFRAALDYLRAYATSADTLVITFSGHGSTYIDANGDETDGLDESLEFFDAPLLDDTLARLLEDLPVGRIALFLDACHSGGQLDSRAVRPRGGVGDEDGLLEDLARTTLSPRDLDQVPRQLAAVTASRFDQYSWELASLQHGLFTYYLLQALGGAADAAGNGDGNTSVEECFAYLAPRVADHASSIGELQTPQLLDHCVGELEVSGTP